MMRKALICLVMLATVSAACKKIDNGPGYDADKQLTVDKAIIHDFVAKNNIAATEDESGISYVLTDPGSGTYNYDNLANTAITVKYTGRLLDGRVFDSNQDGITFPNAQAPSASLAGLIPAWQIALAPKAKGGILVGGLQKGGKIRIIVPSGYAYGPYAQSGAVLIPANSVLDFDIELVDVKTIN